MANGGKLHDIKETASDAVEILREIGTSGVQESLEKVREVAVIGRDIMQIMKEPEWQQNIENMRIISENFSQASERMERTMDGLKETGILEDAKGMIATAREKLESFGANDGQSMKNIQETLVALKEMFESFKSLSNEIRITISESRQEGGTIHNVREASSELRKGYQTLKE